MKLNLGCGTRVRKGYRNIDITPYPGVDLAHDLNIPLPFDDKSVDEIFASHVIEHFWWFRIERVLKDWVRTLKPKGFIDIWTPDLDKIIKLYQDTKDIRLLNYRLYAQINYHKGYAHHAVLDTHTLCKILTSLGCKVRELSNSEYPFDVHKDVNLGVRGYKDEG